MIYGDCLVVWAEEVYLGEAGVALPEAAAVVRVRHVALQPRAVNLLRQDVRTTALL